MSSHCTSHGLSTSRRDTATINYALNFENYLLPVESNKCCCSTSDPFSTLAGYLFLLLLDFPHHSRKRPMVHLVVSVIAVYHSLDKMDKNHILWMNKNNKIRVARKYRNKRSKYLVVFNENVHRL
eukprot:scaffold1206_cov184-Ochromonas_danica.AAC.8